MPTTPAQLTEMIASAVVTALTNQQPVNRDLFNTAASGSISNASIGTQNENLGGHIFRPTINEVPANLYRQTSSATFKHTRINYTQTILRSNYPSDHYCIIQSGEYSHHI